MVEFDTEVIDIIKRTPSIKSFRFKAKEGAEFKAGQYLFLTIKVDGKDMVKCLSFSNSPTEKGYIEITKRISESPFSKALDKLIVGSWARLKMPYGSFILNEEYKKIAFVSGGIGITPIRSMCKYMTDIKLPLNAILLYSNRHEEDIAFKKDLDRAQKENKNFSVIYTLTSHDIKKEKWSGKIGRIDAGMINEEIPDFHERVFYICGPPKMVECLELLLRDTLNVDRDRIIKENFSGY